jgi:2,4-dienoyl-CoA reductase-like NADH-dependent reductase (Old Yellow Enzyme family)
VAGVKIALKPGYQVPFAEAIRKEAGIPTAAVGLITEAKQAEAILAEGQADAIMIARALLNDPYWALRAAEELGEEGAWPEQYARGRPAPATAAPPVSAARTPETEDD